MKTYCAANPADCGIDPPGPAQPPDKPADPSSWRIPASVIADDRVNALLVTGGKEAFEAVDRMLPQLDADSSFARLNFKVFPLQRATAVKLQSTLQPIFANRPPRVKGETIEPVTIVADPWVNALLVGASVDDLAAVSSLVDRLDSEPSDNGLAIHVFPLSKGDARKVAQTIQGLFREGQPNQALPIAVSADDRINAIVVSCGENDAQRIQQLVSKLDTDQVAKTSEIRVFPLQFARADALSTILNTIVPAVERWASGHPASSEFECTSSRKLGAAPSTQPRKRTLCACDV
jgi:hypothetical protein